MKVCRLDDILPETGVAALLAGRQVAVFRVQDRVYALGNHDPFSDANVLSRGIVGDLKGELVVASPVYKQHFSLLTGRCIEDPSVSVPVYAARVENAAVLVDPPRQVKTTCCYCGVGCGVVVESTPTRILSVTGDLSHPANHGRLCTKGSALHLTPDAGLRALHPELRERRAAPRRRASWDEALDLAARRFAACIAEHGPDSVAFYISGQLLTEDYYVFNKLAKGLIGTNNVDTNSRLCMSSAVAGYKRSLGADAPPCSYEDIDHADLVFIAGSNTAFAHPVLFRRIEEARARNPQLKVIVVDPRATVTARAADMHLAIRPGTDTALFNSMLHVMARDGLLDRDYIEAHTEGFDPMADWTPERAAKICDIPAEKVVGAARAFASARAALSLYCQGLNQSVNGTFKNSALINLHLATGQIGRPGAGPFSLTGQPNAMGGREVGGMANLLSAHRDLASEKDRAEVARLWGVPSVPATPGKTAVEIFDGLSSGEIRMAWIACTNPAQSMPDAQAVRRALAKAEFVVLQEAFADAETCDYADVLLPAASWAEKEGTVTNSERRISRVRAAMPPPAEARPDWAIAVDFSGRLKKLLKKNSCFLEYENPEAIFNEHRETTRGRDLDITGLSYALLESRGPQQWPFPEGATAGRTRLYADGVFPTPSGRARFVATEYVPPAESPDVQFPLSLITGRLRDQWHTMTRTGRTAKLFGHSPEPEIALHPEDLRRIGAADGDLVRVASRRGDAVLKARASEDLRRGDAFMAMHWGSRFTAGSGANALTVSATDPHSRQPELKHAAVRVEPVTMAWKRFATCAATVESQRAASALLERFDYAALSLSGNLLCLEAACVVAPEAATLAALEEIFGVEHASRGASRALCACYGVSEAAVRLAAELGESLEAIQARLKCGTSCGSCLPELRRLVRSREAADVTT